MPGAHFSKLAFTPGVKALQEIDGSRTSYARIESQPDTPIEIGPRERAFIRARDSFYMASVSETDWPYVQHRGGQTGFLRVLDETTIGFSDSRGNRQFVSTGNLLHNDRVSLILMDYPNQARLKILGHAQIIEDDKPEILKALTNPGDTSPITRGFLIEVAALEWNCPKYITPRFTVEEIKSLAQSNAQ
ncbi:MAG: pyridoxamine 5-phosphate oxidase [Alphaproteobacteria bacterium]|nr:pyridoxamine 5-phosphate oxidase [Alphaproteobacteria bacterium]